MTRVKVCKIGIKYILLKCKITKTNHLAKMRRNNILESAKKHYSL